MSGKFLVPKRFDGLRDRRNRFRPPEKYTVRAYGSPLRSSYCAEAMIFSGKKYAPEPLIDHS